MLRSLPPSVGPRMTTSRIVTLDFLTASGHPDAVVAGLLLVVIAMLVLLGLAGLIEPVLSLDLFRPDLGFGEFVRIMAKILFSVVALVAAGLGLAKHPRFPTLFLGLAAGITVLVTLELSLWLKGDGSLAFFDIVAVLSVASLPYVIFSRKCRLIFRRRFDLRTIGGDGADVSWALPPPAAMLPAPCSVDQAMIERRARVRHGGKAGSTVCDGSALTVPVKPPDDPTTAALWAALYGPDSPTIPLAEDAESDSEDGHGSSGAGRRVGLESLINLRPPGS